MADTSVEWTKNADGSEGKSWNPIRARRKKDGKVGWHCQKVSPGCANCYAAARNNWLGNHESYSPSGLANLEVYLDEKALLEPLKWKKPTNVFPCSMTDLFGEWVPDEWLDMVYTVEALCPQHTFMNLTKRPERRRQYLESRARTVDFWETCARKLGYSFKFHDTLNDKTYSLLPFPLKNVREGVTVCNQDEAEEKIPILQETPAALRWLSLEPLLGPIELGVETPEIGWVSFLQGLDGVDPVVPGIDWVVVGGESGSAARVCRLLWIEQIMTQCRTYRTPVFVKQLGGNLTDRDLNFIQQTTKKSLQHPKGGNIEEWPKNLRVREVPR